MVRKSRIQIDVRWVLAKLLYVVNVGMRMTKGELREGYILNWKKYPDDEVKIKVSRPTLLSPTKKMKKQFDNEEITWNEYRFRYLEYISYDDEVKEELERIQQLLLDGTNVRLIGYRKSPECHREVLKDLILQERLYILDKTVPQIVSRITKDKIFTFKKKIYREINGEDYDPEYRKFCLEDLCKHFVRTKTGNDRCKNKRKRYHSKRCKFYKYTSKSIENIVSKAGDKMWLEDTVQEILHGK